MAKKYIKLNNNDEHLSLGNLFRIIKDLSKNKTSALQTELFCILFDIKDINDTTVNNYCIGIRGIGSDYKQIIINKEKRYKINDQEFTDIIISILNVIDGQIYAVANNKINFINTNESAITLCKKLYNIAKNDKQVSIDFSKMLQELIDKENIYHALVEIILFIVLKKKQPLYEENLKKEVLENILNDTSISSTSLEEYLSLKLREGINFDYSMKMLADAGNSYACFELGCNEYYGYVSGYPRYGEALKYFKIAAELNHANANYMIGRIYIEGLIGSKTNDELKTGYEFLKKAYNLGNIAAANSIGNMYYKGIYPLKQNKRKAKEYYLFASSYDYVYALNNLGKLAEDDKKYNKAFEYFQKSANLGESWACNKVGEYYRTGVIKKDMDQAYAYYNKALDSNYRLLRYYAYYNIAKYFLMNGYNNIKKDEKKAIEYLKIASDNNVIEASIDLFLYKAKEYKESKNLIVLDDIKDLKRKIECHKKYNNEICHKIENALENINNLKSIDLNCLN